jgi:hypothetical protein
MAKWRDNDPQSVDPKYLRNKAEWLLDKIDDGNTLGIILPFRHLLGPQDRTSEQSSKRRPVVEMTHPPRKGRQQAQTNKSRQVLAQTTTCIVR